MQSGRNRKAVNYVEDLEDDESSKSFLPDDSFAQDTDGDKAADNTGARSSSLFQAAPEENLAGGLCADEADMGQCGLSGDDGPSEYDYLRTGGGFCAEDAETNMDLEGSGNPAVESSLQKDHENHLNPELADAFEGGDRAVQLSSDELNGLPERARSPVVQHNLETCNSASTNTHCNVDSTKDDPPTSLRGSFSAMPFLRKKRKKT